MRGGDFRSSAADHAAGWAGPPVALLDVGTLHKFPQRTHSRDDSLSGLLFNSHYIPLSSFSM